MPRSKPRAFILLVDGRSSCTGVRQCLADDGYVVWQANDAVHAIEELSDFTVRNRPDVVVLEVPSLPEGFDGLSEALRLTSDRTITVLALSPEKTNGRRKRYFARDLDDLKRIICGPHTGSVSCAA